MSRQRIAESGLVSRRKMIRNSLTAGAALAAPWIVSSKALGLSGSIAASERITLGVIGIGPRATYDLQSMLQLPDVQCVAIADVQASKREAGKALVDNHYGNADCQVYRDFRELLSRQDIDAVLIGTGDRWHAHASIMAAQAGKDVYCEKPCGLTIELCERIDNEFSSLGRIFQAGTQRRSVPNFVTAVELAQSGKLGRIHTIVASVYEPQLDNSWLPAEPSPDREIVDWNLWLGPAPWRPYNKNYVAGGWRGYWDFDSGAKLLDWGAHTVDLCQWANQADKTMPLRFEPSDTRITGHCDNGVTLILDFLKTPFQERPGWIQRLGTCPVRFVGEDGWVETGDSGEIVVEPASLMKELGERYKKTSGLDVSLHARNFFDSVKSRQPTVVNSQIMRNSHTVCHAAALAWILKRTLTIDPASGTFLEDAEANSLRHRPERDPFAS